MFKKTILNLSVFIVLILIPLNVINLFAQDKDTVSISLDQAENLFLKNNLSLLAAKYNIDAAKARIIQEKLLDNPILTFEQNVYNQNTKRWFDITSTGNSAVQIDQLILLAGKRDKRIQIAQINQQISEYQFYDLIRELKFQLCQYFYQLYYSQKNLEINQNLLKSLNTTEKGMSVLYDQGAASLKELLRIKSLVLNLEIESRELISNINDAQSNLELIMGTKISFKPVVEETDVYFKYNLEEIKNLSLNNRYDLLQQKEILRADSLNLALQKSLAIPDITLSGRWDRQGNYIPNYYALMIQVPIPLFNRNQGNIQYSEFSIESDNKTYEEQKIKIINDVVNTYNKAKEYDALLKKFDNNFMDDYKNILDGVQKSFDKRSIGLLEFIDYYQSFKDNATSFNKLKLDRIIAFEELNYLSGKNIIGKQ